MTLNRNEKRRDLNEPEIVAALRAAGLLVHRNDRLCDLIVCERSTGRVTLLEVKNPDSGRPRLTPDQTRAVEDGWPLVIVTEPLEAIRAARTGFRSG